MKKYGLLFLLFASLSLPATAQTKMADMCYELRIYHTHPGKLNDLLKRFRNHTIYLFEKHGMNNVAYWTPLDNPEGKLYYLMAYPSREARDASWKAFNADTTWQRVYQESHVNGPLVSKVESIFLKTTDFSPNDLMPEAGKVWELRIYTASEGNLPNLLSRFRNHTVELFRNHGMGNKVYFTVDGEGSDKMLYYLLTHPSEPAGKAAFDRFRQDPVWQQVRADSEKAAGGSLTTNVTSIYMWPTDFSPVK